MPLYELHDSPILTEPVMVMVLEGWIDAGHAAGNAAQTLLGGLDTFPVASFDSDTLLDHRARRPVMHLVDGVNRGLSWPAIELRAAGDEAGNDLLLLLGPEPDHAWRAFTSSALDLAQQFGARMVVGLGEYPAMVPHTRPVTLSVTASSDELAAVSGLLRGTLDVPAGVQAAIEQECSIRDVPAVGLWAQVPHYIGGEVAPYPAASVALLRQLERASGLKLPLGTLEADAERTRHRIDAAMATNSDNLEMLRTLESNHDEQHGTPGPVVDGPLPSADELAAEVERFLRDQGRDD